MSTYKYLTHGRKFDGKIYDLYDTAKNPSEAKESIKKAQRHGYNYHRVLTKKRFLEIWVRR